MNEYFVRFADGNWEAHAFVPANVALGCMSNAGASNTAPGVEVVSGFMPELSSRLHGLWPGAQKPNGQDVFGILPCKSPVAGFSSYFLSSAAFAVPNESIPEAAAGELSTTSSSHRAQTH